MIPLRALPAVFLASAIAPFSAGDEIKVTPAPGALGAALAKAKSGDVIKLGAGEYPESVRVPAGVSIEGAGADQTTLVGTDYAAINCTGAHTRIAGLTIRGGDRIVRGVNSSTPVRVERCRFVGVKEAVALMIAPLSDVVACEFIDCGIGVRAIGGASPTVWGCAFKGGNQGVFALQGSPYVRNNLFQQLKEGLRHAPGDRQPAIIRNNLFAGCSEAAVMLVGGDEPRLSPPSLRNLLVVDCGAVVIGSKALVSRISHLVLQGGTAFRDREGKETLRAGEASIREGEAGVRIENDFQITVAGADLVEGRGVRLNSEPEGTKGTIGLEKEWRRVGVGATATLPPTRWTNRPLIANSVREEYQYLEVLGRRGRSSQAVFKDQGIMVDRLKPGDGVEPAEFLFDISRFYAEEGLVP